MAREQIHMGDMSHETAIDILKLMLEAMETYDGILPTPARINAIKMAIEALEQEPIYYPPCIDCNKKMDEIRRAYDKLKEQNVAISQYYHMEVEKLPPVNLQPKTGHWICTIEDWNKWTCSECGFCKRTDIHVSLGYNYCPNCGAKMESENKK